jgi:activator of 2-hydroxyglutaryl-CoA dehydratase
MLPLSPDRAYILYDPAAEARVHVPRWQQQAARHLGAALVVYGTADPAQEATLDLSVRVSPLAGGDGFMPSQRTAPVVVGIDVGSTTVKAVVLDPDTREILWSDYQRHQTKQPEKVLRAAAAHRGGVPDLAAEAWRVFMTGSGAMPLCAGLGAKFVQEVNAVTLAVEKLHPDVGA